MRNLKMVVSYVGTRFAGWQVQPGRATVQGVLEERIARMLREPVRITGAGRTVARVHARLDVEAMRRAARDFLGTHDFTSFCPADSEIEDKVRALRVSEVTESGPEVRYRVVGSGFLRHMVRTLAGTLILAGRGRLDTGSIPHILKARDRRRAGPVAPARGLVLETVFYGEGP